MDEEISDIPTEPLLTKKTKLILSAVGGSILLIGIIVGYLLYANAAEGKIIEKEMRWYQCKTLCPTEIKTVYDQVNKTVVRSRLPEASCEIYCKKKYIDPSKAAIERIFNRDNAQTQQLARFQREYALCSEKMTQNLDFNSADCFAQVFKRYTSLATINNLTIGEYPKYPSFTLHMLCNKEPMLFISLTGGTPHTGKLDIHIIADDNTMTQLKNQEPPQTGETKNYSLILENDLSKKAAGVEVTYAEGNSSYFVDGAACISPELPNQQDVSQIPKDPTADVQPENPPENIPDVPQTVVPEIDSETPPEEIQPDEILPEDSSSTE